MKKVNNDLSFYFRDVCLYLDDIYDLVKLFQDNFDKTVVIIADYEFSDISKIPELKQSLVHSMEIRGSSDNQNSRGRQGFISLFLRPSFSWLNISDQDDVMLYGLALKIKEILKRRKHFSRLLFSKWKPFLSILIFQILVILLKILFRYADIIYYILVFGTTTSFILVWVLLTIKYKEKRIRIYLHQSNSKLNIFQRKGDELLVGAIIALISAVAGGVITFLIDHLINPKP